MKDLLKKYYELDEESKENLPFLYMYEALLSIKDDYENVEIKNISDEETLMQIIVRCWFSSKLDPSEIIDKIFQILDCQDITIEDLASLDIDELLELIADEETPQESSKILSEFSYGNFCCVFLKHNNQYLLTVTNGNESDVIKFDKLEDIFIPAINKHLIDKELYGKARKYDDTDL